jgi:hypothetical protein
LHADVTVAEGSHWMMLANDASTSAARALAIERFDDRAELERRLREASSSMDAFAFARGVDEEMRARWSEIVGAARMHEPDLAFHDSRDAALVTSWLAEARGRALHFVSGADARGWMLLRFGA